MVAPRIDDVRLPVESTHSGPTEQPTTSYQVAEGDTLARIAAKLSRQLGRQVTVEELCRLNPQFDFAKVGGGYETTRRGQAGWDPDHIRTGERLIVPAAPAQTSASETPVVTPPDETQTDRLETQQRPGSPVQMGPERTSPEVGIAPGNVVPTRTEQSPVVVDGESTPQEVTGEESSVAGSTGRPTATTTEEETPSAVNKIFGAMRKLFQNPIFQGILAVLNTIPGVSTIASAVGLCTGLLSCIGAMVAEPGKPPWMTLASTLLYGVGTFIPGVGAFGGLLGMTTGVEHEKAGQMGRRPRTEQTQQASTPPRSETYSDTDYAQRLQRVRQNPTAIEDAMVFDEWLTAAGELRQERQLVTKRLADQQQLGAEERRRLEARQAELDDLFDHQLPEQIAAQLGTVAFDITDLSIPEVPTAGRLYVLGQGETLASIAARIEGLEQQPGDLVAALRSFNNLETSQDPSPGTMIYLPSAEQLARRPESGWPAHWPMAHREGADRRQRVTKLLELSSESSTPAVVRARQLAAIYHRMPVTPMEQPVYSIGDDVGAGAGVDVRPEA